MRVPPEPAILPEADAALQPKETITAQPVKESKGEAEAEKSDKTQNDDVDALIELVAEENPGLGAGELVDKLRAEHQDDVTVQKVSGVLRRAKQTAPAA